MIEFSVYFSIFIYSKEKKNSTKFLVIIKINATNQNKAFFMRITMKERSTTRWLKRACIFH